MFKGHVCDDLACGSLLVDSGEQWYLHVFHAAELGVGFVIRIHEMLNFSHSELTDSKETLLGVNFVTEAETDLGCCEGHAAVVEVEEAAEVYEDTLGCLGSEEAAGGTSGADLGLEHQVERDGLRKIVASLGCLNRQFANDRI